MSVAVLEQISRWAREQHLATPVQLFSRQAVTDALARLRQHLHARISYAVKANTHPLMLQAVRDVDEYNVTNLAHLNLLLQARVDPRRVAFVNPVVDETTARAAIDAGVTRFVVDDERGLRRLTALSTGLRLTLRLRPSRDGQATRSIIRFGAAPEELVRLGVLAAHSGAHVEALSFFIGTHSEDLATAAPYRRALQELAEVRAKLSAEGLHIPTVNIGGGFPGARRRFHRDHPDFFQRLDDHLRAALPSEVDVLCEPGRFLAEPSMAMLTTVVADRVIGGRRMTHLDVSGYSGLFETTFIDAGGASLDVVAPRGGESWTTQLLGPIMDSFDVIKRDAVMPRVEDGDTLLLPNTGAYSFGYTAGCEGVRQPHLVPLPAALDRLLADTWFE
jgi:diaminopimelate decarboxylase